MKNNKTTATLLGFGLLVATLSMARAGDLPPPGSKSLSTILQAVDAHSLGVITSMEFDDGWWEVKVCKGDTCQKLYIDPKSGEEKRRKNTVMDDDELPPANAKSVATIVQWIEGRVQGTITEVEFDDGSWEIKLRHGGRKIKLDVNPLNGDIKR